MGDLYDAVTWSNLLPFSGPVMAYLDGRISAWPAEAYRQLGARVVLRVTVLANESAQVFDYEAGNAGAAEVATAVANRLQAKQWSVVYSNRDDLPGMTQALRTKSVNWSDASIWPRPGVYFHAADPTGHPHLSVPWAPVQPVAVQDRWMGGYDISSTYGSYPYVLPPRKVPAVPRGATPEKIVAVSSAWNNTREGGQFDVCMVGESGKVYHLYWEATVGWGGPEILTNAQ